MLAEAVGSPVKTSLVLERIANALECSVEAFVGPSSTSAAQTAELMRLWSLIEHEQDRAKVLSFLRSIAPAAAAQQDR